MTVSVGILNDTDQLEQRVVATPESVVRLKKAGFDVLVEAGAGDASFYADDLYTQAGAVIGQRSEVLKANVVMSISEKNTLTQLANELSNQWVVGMFGTVGDDEAAQPFVELNEKSGVTVVDVTRLPRQLSMAQSMDAMTSQNSVAGYKAVILAADNFPKFLPMMTTAAGTVRPARVLILGAGIAGLQAIGTAKRLGAIVTAYDVRPASKEEVLSLGAKFLEIDAGLSEGQGEGGYARKLTVEEAAAQQAAVDAAAANFDIIITTAQVPGRKPPVLLTKEGVANLGAGSVIVDCGASELGGNVEGSKPNETININGVKIIGAPTLPSETPNVASALLARNFADIISHFLVEDTLTVQNDEELDAALLLIKHTATQNADANVEGVN
ncbi:MAG: NAD(P) transhydrogenase subunit alpha [Lactobacillaceae bacterium]|jgi:NAD(P) transhydrogenase subunit alpha|nr:NAD(P) transhydrogenase subunit alpha [Lactobacillaceae bacterium]